MPARAPFAAAATTATATARGNGGNISDGEHAQLLEHCRTVGGKGVAIPDRKLTTQIRSKFPNLAIHEVLLRLPLFPNQQSPGLWLSKSTQELETEAQRQNPKPKTHIQHPPTEEELRALEQLEREEPHRKSVRSADPPSEEIELRA